jgi:hypothetical protein
VIPMTELLPDRSLLGSNRESARSHECGHISGSSNRTGDELFRHYQQPRETILLDVQNSDQLIAKEIFMQTDAPGRQGAKKE